MSDKVCLSNKGLLGNSALEVFNLIADIMDSDPEAFKAITSNKPQESVELLTDHIRAISEDARKFKSKPYSSSQVERLHGVRRTIHLKPYRHTSIKTKHSWDNSSHDRFVFYNLKYHRRQGFYADNIIKCVKISDSAGLVYAFSAHQTNGDSWCIFITSHVLDRIAQRKGISLNRVEALDEAFQEWRAGLLIRDFGLKGEGEVWAYSNDGIFIGKGISSNPTSGSGLLGDLLEDYKQNEDPFAVRYLLCKTYITNEMAKYDQIQAAGSGVRIEFMNDCLYGGVSYEIYQHLLKKLS